MKKRQCQGLTAEKQTKMHRTVTDLRQNKTNFMPFFINARPNKTNLRQHGIKFA